MEVYCVQCPEGHLRQKLQSSKLLQRTLMEYYIDVCF